VRHLIFIVLLLAGCGSLPQPFSKDQPLSMKDPLVAPPWQAMVKAGPKASTEIDLETLNGPLRAPQTASADAAPQSSAQAPEPQPTPQSTPLPTPNGRVAITSVAVLAVEGGGPKSNRELTDAMRDTLSGAGWTVRNTPAKDALTIRGQVSIAKAEGRTQAIRLSWTVAKPDGAALGTISQANSVPAGSLDKGWGENARAATEAAATGIFDLINKFR
jgi:hypothetical protein